MTSNATQASSGQVNPGRFTVMSDDEVTVFLIGMRVNFFRRAAHWLPVAAAMPRMLKHLAADPDAGMLSYSQWISPGRTTMLVSYWRSPEHLQRFAADTDSPHLEPWRRFQRTVGSSGTVGVWHETYVSRPGEREVIYVNMPTFGLGQAVGAQPVGRGTSTARQRLARH